MSDTRQSIMILPRRPDGSLLLQTWTNEQGTITDAFGSFYAIDENPEQIAQRELKSFDIQAQLSEVAHLQYFINKPTGLVDLRLTVYFADITDEPPLRPTMHWFAPADIPYKEMHPATGKWLPLLLDGHVPLQATVHVEQKGDHTTGVVTDFTLN